MFLLCFCKNFFNVSVNVISGCYVKTSSGNLDDCFIISIVLVSF